MRIRIRIRNPDFWTSLHFSLNQHFFVIYSSVFHAEKFRFYWTLRASIMKLSDFTSGAKGRRITSKGLLLADVFSVRVHPPSVHPWVQAITVIKIIIRNCSPLASLLYCTASHLTLYSTLCNNSTCRDA